MLRIIFLSVMVLDLLVPFVIAIPYQNYSHTKMVMSVLGGKDSPWGTAYNIWMILSGIAFTLLAGTLFSAYREGQFGLALTLFILVALYGVGDEVVSGFFPLNGPAPDGTLQYKVHGTGSVLGFTALQFAPLILAIIAFRSQQLLIGWGFRCVFCPEPDCVCLFCDGGKAPVSAYGVCDDRLMAEGPVPADVRALPRLAGRSVRRFQPLF